VCTPEDCPGHGPPPGACAATRTPTAHWRTSARAWAPLRALVHSDRRLEERRTWVPQETQGDALARRGVESSPPHKMSKGFTPEVIVPGS
jgi:hypothetical protein